MPGVAYSDRDGARNWVSMRPDGIRRCNGGDHPVLLLREIGGPRSVAVRIDEAEARRLAGEFEGMRRRHSRTYETLELLIKGLGGTVVALRLFGDRQRGLSGEIEVATDSRHVRSPAHPGDVAALSRRLDLAVLVPSHAANSPLEELGAWPSRDTSEPAPHQMPALHHGADPEDYDW